MPPVLMVIANPGLVPKPIKPLLSLLLASVMVPPLLILISVALPNPAIEALVPPVIVTGCAMLIFPVNAWLPLIVTALVPVLLKLIVPSPAASLVNV